MNYFHKVYLSGIPWKNGQSGSDNGNQVAKVFRLGLNWVCPMGTYVWVFQVLCLRNEITSHFSRRRLEWLRHNFAWDRLISHQTDHAWPTIPKISTRLSIFWGDTWTTEFVETIHIENRAPLEEKSNGFHTKCSIEVSTILMFVLLLCCHRAARCM